jgi:hypothetical protein
MLPGPAPSLNTIGAWSLESRAATGVLIFHHLQLSG